MSDDSQVSGPAQSIPQALTYGSKPWTEETVCDLLERLAAGEMLRDICRSNPDRYPSSATVRRWVIDNVNGIAERFTRARELGIHEIIDETIEISDDNRNDTATRMIGGKEVEVCDHEWIQRSKLRVDTRKWLASKIVPKIYGEKIEQQIVGKNGDQPVEFSIMIDRVNEVKGSE